MPTPSPVALAATLALAASAPLCAENDAMTFELRADAFAPEGAIPTRYTCEGEDISPALHWSGVPPGTRSLALVLDDPDAPDPKAPRTTWVHWVLYNLPPAAVGLPAGVTEPPAGALHGRNDWGRTGYGGPCPPIGRHRYFHKLYALDTLLPDLNRPTKGELEQAMRGHVLAHAELIGTYEKHKR
jgi:Raf kinase inhibitor-like YbhB/YbcL family protein